MGKQFVFTNVFPIAGFDNTTNMYNTLKNLAIHLLTHDLEYISSTVLLLLYKTAL